MGLFQQNYPDMQACIIANVLLPWQQTWPSDEVRHRQIADKADLRRRNTLLHAADDEAQ